MPARPGRPDVAAMEQFYLGATGERLAQVEGGGGFTRGGAL